VSVVKHKKNLGVFCPHKFHIAYIQNLEDRKNVFLSKYCYGEDIKDDGIGWALGMKEICRG
jgi:hypothetical protein